MNALELKVPPPVVASVLAVAMWVVSRSTPTLEIDPAVRIAVALALALAGAAAGAAGIASFRRARTTLDPMKPEAASSLVTDGIYRFTRNPMYVGILLVLLAWAAFLGAPWTLLGPVAFVAYLTRFQITPEERILMARFGDAYAIYKARVRRWL
jgi:protein-S-isoprenylcysteine O-methyltransferase Ste14